MKHQVATHSEKLEDDTTGQFYALVGTIDGEPILRQQPISRDNLHAAHVDMRASLERFLNGEHHPSHYRGRFEYLAVRS